MSTKKLNFSEMKNALSRSEMKKIMAGSGSCCWHTADWSEQQCNMAKADAQAMQHQTGGLWCCASC